MTVRFLSSDLEAKCSDIGSTDLNFSTDQNMLIQVASLTGNSWYAFIYQRNDAILKNGSIVTFSDVETSGGRLNFQSYPHNSGFRPKTVYVPSTGMTTRTIMATATSSAGLRLRFKFDFHSRGEMINSTWYTSDQYAANYMKVYNDGDAYFGGKLIGTAMPSQPVAPSGAVTIDLTFSRGLEILADSFNVQVVSAEAGVSPVTLGAEDVSIHNSDTLRITIPPNQLVGSGPFSIQFSDATIQSSNASDEVRTILGLDTSDLDADALGFATTFTAMDHRPSATLTLNKGSDSLWNEGESAFEGPLTIDVSFEESGVPVTVAGLEPSDFLVTPANAATVQSVTLSGTTYVASVLPTEEVSNLQVALAEGAAVFTDEYGSWNTLAGSSPVFETKNLAPRVASAGFVSASDLAGADGWFGPGDVIRVAVEMTQTVSVTEASGSYVELDIGGSTVQAVLEDGADTRDTLGFAYVIVAGDQGAITLNTSSLNILGTIRGTVGNQEPLVAGNATFASADLVSEGLEADGVRPQIQNVAIASMTDAYPITIAPATGIPVTVTFSEAVTSVDPSSVSIPLELDDGGVLGATYVSGNGTDTWSFTYAVVQDDRDDDGIALGGTLVGSITDAAGNALLPALPANAYPSVLVDGIIPRSVAIDPVGSAALRPVAPSLGDEVAWKITFSETVSNVDVTDFELTYTPVDTSVSTTNLDLAIGSVSPDSTIADEYTLTVTGTDLQTLDGQLSVDFADGQDVSDVVGNAFSLDGASSDSAAAIVVDSTAPVVEWRDAGDGIVNPGEIRIEESVAFAAKVLVTDEHELTYAIEGPDAAALEVNSAGEVRFVSDPLPDYELPDDQGRDGVYDATLVVTDEANNVTRVDLQIAIVNVPEGDVTVLLAVSEGQGANTAELVAPFDVDVLFREPVAGFGDVEDVWVRGGVVTNVESISDRTPPHQFRITVDALTTGDVTLRIPAEVVLTPAGVPNAESEPLTVRALADKDGDGVPDVRDPDRDGDGVPNEEDAFPDDAGEDSDRDGDGVGDNGDAFPDDPGESKDSDGDGVGNNSDDDLDGDGIVNDADPDMDGDGVPNEEDDFPRDPNASRDQDGDGIPDGEDTDADGDGIPDVNDPDRDNDGVPNEEDAFPDDPFEDSDRDGDGVGDNRDAFPDDPTEDTDTDGDGVGDNADPDVDGDGVPNDEDDFPRDAGGSKDSDGDGIPDDRDAFPEDPEHFGDLDGDGIPDGEDTDRDGDGVPNVRDPFPSDPTGGPDADGDGVPDSRDAFPNDPTASKDDDGDGVPNGRDGDMDGDGIPNDQDRDRDGDGVPNEDDDFPDDGGVSRDTDGDGVPDRFDPDMDGDGIPNHVDGDQDGDGTPDANDAFPHDPHEDSDRDEDGVGDNADAFPDDPTGQRDTDGDGIPDSRDDDIDGDGVPNENDPDPNDGTVRRDSDGDGVPDEVDAFPSNPEESADTDGDGIGDNEDGDLDGDGVPNEEDAFPYDARESSDRDGDGIGDNADAFPDDATRSGDLDGDGIPDELDPDIDGDGVLNEFDAFPRDPSEDRDADGDGVGDNADAFPDDPSESRDTDGDGVGDNSDSDLDGDGLPNETDPDPYRFTSRVNLAWDVLPRTVVETTTFSLRAEPVIAPTTQMGVAQSLGSPSGVVLLYFGDVVLRETLAADGSLTWVGTLPGGSYEIRAVYLGDVRFARSETEPESVRVEGPVSLFEEVEEDVQFLIEEGTREALSASMDANARVLTAARGRHHRGGAFNSLGTSLNPEVEYDGTFTASAEDGIVADGDIALEGASRLGAEGRAAVFVAGFASTTMNPGEVRTSLEASIAVETFLEDEGVTVGAFGTALSTSGSVQQNELVGVRGEYSLSVGGFLISPLVGALSLEAYAAGGVVGVNLDVANDVVRIQSVSQRLQAQLGVYVSGSLDVSILTITPSFGLAIGGVQSGIAPIDAYAHGVSGETETQVDGEEILRSSFEPTFTVNLSRIAWLQSLDPLDVTVTPTVQCDLSFGDATQCGWGLDAGFRVPLPYAVDGAVLASDARYEWKGERRTFGAKLYVTYPY